MCINGGANSGEIAALSLVHCRALFSHMHCEIVSARQFSKQRKLVTDFTVSQDNKTKSTMSDKEHSESEFINYQDGTGDDINLNNKQSRRYSKINQRAETLGTQ